MSKFRQVWFLRLLAVSPLVCTLSDGGLLLKRKKSSSRLIKWEQFSSGPVRRRGMLFSSIEFQTDGKKETIPWLSKSTSCEFRELVYRRLIELHARRANTALSHVASLVNRSGYLRTSEAQEIAQFGGSQIKRLILPPTDIELPRDQTQPFEELQQWAKSDPTRIEQTRKDFVATELDQFRALFDSVESNPLGFYPVSTDGFKTANSFLS
ncbi:hypothetical protein [Marinobacter alexandrii]|jgi:DNA helicase-4|uniref:hypothetical protein n=1 Tax=Marinobacter alexandrii TaxID=2570351 RepID=UPI002ABE5343|nr:hypothetical protein [Marinobacter alexandrii]